MRLELRSAWQRKLEKVENSSFQIDGAFHASSVRRKSQGFRWKFFFSGTALAASAEMVSFPSSQSAVTLHKNKAIAKLIQKRSRITLLGAGGGETTKEEHLIDSGALRRNAVAT